MTLRSADEMRTAFKLPMLPGTTCGEELLRKNFRKKQILSGTAEQDLDLKPVPMDYDETDSKGVAQTVYYGKHGLKDGSGGAGAGGGSLGATNLAAMGVDAGAMASLNHAMKATEKLMPVAQSPVLRFFGYFAEPVTESALERSRIRKVTICFFVEDGTVSVMEPRQDNSGIVVGGSMVKRHAIPKQTADGDGDAGYVTYQDLGVGETVAFYGRQYHLTGCDNFTREFMGAMGLEQGPELESPTDQYTEIRRKKAKNHVESVSTVMNQQGMKVKLSRGEVDAAKQFFQNDRRVLRCRATSDDSHTLYGSVRKFSLYYFLADDAIEIVEKVENNSGRDPFPSFCRRQKVLKPEFASTASKGVTFGKSEQTNRGTYYTDADISIGARLKIAGREFLIYDYDEFTRTHMRDKFGVTEYSPIEKYSKDVPKPVVKREPPPYNGFGSEDDSLSSWRSLEPRAARKVDTMYTKHGESVVKFSLKLDNDIDDDADRKFTLTCFMADNTLAIYEPPQRNTGIVGGKFLQRTEVKNPLTNKLFKASDFHVGSKVVINKFPFIVLATDERSLNFMEQNSGDFDHSNINTVVRKIQAMLLSQTSGLTQALEARGDTEVIHCDILAEIFTHLGLPISGQEVITVLRYFDRNGEYSLTYHEILQRLLGGEAEAMSDPQDWASIYEDMQRSSQGPTVTSEVEVYNTAVENTTAAYAARTFMEAYKARRHRFHTAFKFATDYATDSLIGVPELRRVVAEQLQLPLSAPQLDALGVKLFPHGARRVTYEEFLRLLNSTSQFDHNMNQIMSRR